MKFVLSRKGFDSQYGGIPSPILPDGRLVPLPIPSRHDKQTFSDLAFEDIDMGKLLGDLSGGRVQSSDTIHHDPWLMPSSSNSIPGWRPSLGQTGSAQSHLAKSEVGAGDTFLFFGWFRRVEEVAGKYRYIKSEPQLHVIFGWLEVDEVLSVVSDRQGSLDRHPWVSAHPHVLSPEHYDDPKNTIYVGKSRSELGSSLEPGGGYLRRFDPMLQLTAPGKTRSIWSLPEWFHPGNGRTPMSYHASEDRWTRDQHRVLLRSVAKGQEFVVDGAEYPEMSEWASAIIRAGRA